MGHVPVSLVSSGRLGITRECAKQRETRSVLFRMALWDCFGGRDLTQSPSQSLYQRRDDVPKNVPWYSSTQHRPSLAHTQSYNGQWRPLDRGRGRLLRGRNLT